MPPIVLYLIKLSLCLGVIYLFYWLVLRRLTFYNGNRWYLLGYSVLAFFIPFVNIGPILARSDYWQDSSVIRLIPAMGASEQLVLPGGAVTTDPGFFAQSWQWLFVFMGLGILLMLVRLVMQYFSFQRIRKESRLIIDEDVKVYQVDKPIIPFSFGKSIFINQSLHPEEELQKIIRHEFVHVRQRHTIDIIWSEVLCMLNWYNPFCWLIRRAIRQNLEFIADQQVLNNGIDRKEYQYLLLKVMGAPGFRIAAAFNFNSLKKRIFMMNQVRSARINLIRFLFILPLVAILLLAFRERLRNEGEPGYINYAGMVMDGQDLHPLAGVELLEKISGKTARTDGNGYFKLHLPAVEKKTDIELEFTWKGDKIGTAYSSLLVKDRTRAYGMVDFIGLNTGAQRSIYFQRGVAGMADAPLPADPDYSDIRSLYETFLSTQQEFMGVSTLNDHPYIVANGKSYLMGAHATHVELNGVVDIIYVNGKRMTGAEVNNQFKRAGFAGLGAHEEDGDTPAYFEALTVPAGKDTVPGAAVHAVTLHREDALTPKQQAFFDKHPDVYLLRQDLDRNLLQVYHSGGMTAYKTTVQADQNAFDKKYGTGLMEITGLLHDQVVVNVVEKPLYIVNGRQVAGDSLRLIPASRIKNINVEKKVDTNKELVNVTLQEVTVQNHPKPLIRNAPAVHLEFDGNVIVADSMTVQPNDGPVLKIRGEGRTVTVAEKKEDDKNLLSHFDGVIMVEGKQYDGVSFEKLNLQPSAIKSITVLKDPTSTKLYGEKGKNGVIVIDLKETTSDSPEKVKEIPITTRPSNHKLEEVTVVGYSANAGNALKKKPVTPGTVEVLNVVGIRAKTATKTSEQD